MTHRCPYCGKNLRTHVDGGGCRMLQHAVYTPPSRAPPTRRPRW